jgi:RNA polymerase sigma factor (sigma-70 family)
VFIKVLRFQEITEGGFEIPKIGSLISFLAQQTWAQYMRLRGDVNFRNYDDDPSILFETEICTELVDHINPSDILEMSEKHNGLMEKISELSVLDQKIIDMTFVQNLPPDKVSKRLGLSSANIRMRITRIRRNLGSYEEDKCESTRS